MTTGTIADGLSVATAALTLLSAGHANAAAGLMVAASRYAAPAVDLIADDRRRLRVRVREATA